MNAYTFSNIFSVQTQGVPRAYTIYIRKSVFITLRWNAQEFHIFSINTPCHKRQKGFMGYTIKTEYMKEIINQVPK